MPALYDENNSWQWHLDSGHNTTAIPLTASHHPLFYVKATTGAMYNSSSYFTEGRILIGQDDYLADAGFPAGDLPRWGAGDMPNVPAHISIVSETPTMLLHQTQNSTAPTIVMTSAHSGNMDALGPISGNENAATYISNRDGGILNIETTTNYMEQAVFDPTSTSVAETRIMTQYRAHVWSLDYYDATTDEDDALEQVEYFYMRMGSANKQSTSAGSHYLPVSDTGTYPVGMAVGGFWLDTREYEVTVDEAPTILGGTDNPIVRVRAS